MMMEIIRNGLMALMLRPYSGFPARSWRDKGGIGCLQVFTAELSAGLKDSLSV